MNRKVTPAQCCEIFRLYQTGNYLNHDIAKNYNIKSTGIKNIIKKVAAE